MPAVTPLARGLTVVALLALAALVARAAGLQGPGAIALGLVVATGTAACINSGQGLHQLYDRERLTRIAAAPAPRVA